MASTGWSGRQVDWPGLAAQPRPHGFTGWRNEPRGLGTRAREQSRLTSRFGLDIRAADSVDAPGVAELMQAAGLHANPAAIAARLERLRAERTTLLLAVEWGPPSGLIVFHLRQTLLADLPVVFVSTRAFMWPLTRGWKALCARSGVGAPSRYTPTTSARAVSPIVSRRRVRNASSEYTRAKCS